VNVDVSVFRGALRALFVASHGRTAERDLVLLTVTSADGTAGHGEAAPLESYDGVRTADVLAALEDCRPLLGEWDGDPATRAELLAACRSRAVLPHAVAAIDLALWDHSGRRAGAPVWKLLDAASAPPVEVNATIGASDRAGAAREAAAARAAGFRCVKVKVGIGDDAGRLAAVRATVGPDLAIRIDANGAWSVLEATAALRALAPVGIECCEEPVHGLAELSQVSAQTAVPVALDESAALPGALTERHAAVACLKVARCGGITGLIEAAAAARGAGYEIYLASTLDGPLGIAAALHAAAVIRPDRASGLATLPMFEARPDVLPATGGRMTVPAGSGLGDRLRSWYA
jgi:L-alanine-DL-glutamate epimerase-like enolase superfamily enzyme